MRAGLASVLLVSGVVAAYAASAAQDGQASASHRETLVYSKEIVLDQAADAALTVNFLISAPMIDGKSKLGCRVVSILGFTTVRGRLQFDLAHLSPSVSLGGTAPIEFLIGFDEEGAAGDFEVTLTPRAGKDWGTLVDLSDVEIATTRL